MCSESTLLPALIHPPPCHPLISETLSPSSQNVNACSMVPVSSQSRLRGAKAGGENNGWRCFSKSLWALPQHGNPCRLLSTLGRNTVDRGNKTSGKSIIFPLARLDLSFTLG